MTHNDVFVLVCSCILIMKLFDILGRRRQQRPGSNNVGRRRDPFMDPFGSFGSFGMGGFGNGFGNGFGGGGGFHDDFFGGR